MVKHDEPRSLIGKLQRGLSILKRYGFGHSRMKQNLTLYTSILKDAGISATFPVTASVVHKNSNLLKKLANSNMEIAIHGYTHLDFTKLSQEELLEQMEKGIKVFQDFELPFSGFRSPYLRWNGDTVKSILESGFSYSSNDSLLWGVLELRNLSRDRRISYNRVLDFYGAKHANDCLSLPKFLCGLLDIPVSLPDDEILIDRLRMRNAVEIGRIWNLILDATHKNGELFTLQLHPERIRICFKALKNLLQRAISMTPSVWITNLSEIAEWWKKKNGFKIKASRLDRLGNHMIEVYCHDNATVLARNVQIHGEKRRWADGYKLVDSRSFRVTSPVRPFVGVSSRCSDDFVNLLQENGYAVEISDDSSDYGIYLDETIQASSERDILGSIESSDAPILRFWRWPGGAKSALCVTGDIDSATLWDFMWRIWKK